MQQAKERNKQGDLDLDNVLDTTSTKKSKGKKDEIPVLATTPEIEELVTRIRKAKADAESKETEFKNLSNQVLTLIMPQWETLCKDKWQGTVKLKASDGTSVKYNMKHKYSKTPLEMKETLISIMGDERLQKYITLHTDISIKPSKCNEADLKKLINVLGVEMFKEYCEVDRYFYPEEKYTQDFYKEFDENQRQVLVTILVPNKPALLTK